MLQTILINTSPDLGNFSHKATDSDNSVDIFSLCKKDVKRQK